MKGYRAEEIIRKLSERYQANPRVCTFRNVKRIILNTSSANDYCCLTKEVEETIKMNEKKAQFYILTAAIIAIVLTGLIAIVNYAVVKPEPVQFYDLTKQLENEVNRVIDYGTYSGKDVAVYVEDFVKYFLAYAQEKDPDLGIIYIYGNSSYLVVANYGKNDSGVFTDVNKTVLTGGSAQAVSTVRMDIGGTQIGKKIIEQQRIFGNIRQTFGPSKQVVVNISDKMYNFDLRGQQYFFAIIESTKDNETYYSIVS